MDDYIDYADSTDTEPALWTQAAFKKYFMATYRKVHHVGGAVPWGIKEQTMLSRMFKDYSHLDIVDMILYWHTSSSQSGVACQFSNLYARRTEVYHAMKKATEDYSWEN